MNSLLSIEETKHFLEINESQLEKLISQGRLKAYRIGGTYLRFRKEEVEVVKPTLSPEGVVRTTGKVRAKAHDFWKFNNFYLISFCVIAFLFVFWYFGF